MTISREIHWKAPSLALGAFLVGIALALGHHFFYSSLDNTEVPTIQGFGIGYWTGVSPQRFNIAVGTLFAFLVKTSLCLAAGVGYVQILWKSLKAKTTKVSTVDSASSLTEDLLAFFDFSVWRRYPLLILVAFIIWLTPLAAVITPSSLSVDVKPHIVYAIQNVSNVDFTSLNFASLPNYVGLSSSFAYVGPQFPVTKVAIGTAAQGEILSIPAPNSAPNASYELIFIGPSLQCQDVSSGPIAQNISASIYRASRLDDCSTSYGYLSWVPDLEGDTPFIASKNGTLTPRTRTLGPFDAVYESNLTALSIYVATLPDMSNKLQPTCDKFSPANITQNATITYCELLNTTYHATFSWSNGAQTVDISKKEIHGGVKAEQSIEGVAPLALFNPNGSMYKLPTPEDKWSYDVSIVQRFAYESVMDAFGELLVGSISNSQTSRGALVIANTSVMNTVLGDLHELDFLRTYGSGVEDVSKTTFQEAAVLSNATWDGTSVQNVSAATMPSVGRALEDLFQNITISLMSSPPLQANMTSPYAPPPVNVTFETYRSVYVYSPLTLGITYGIAVLLSGAAVAMGMAAIIANGASFSNSFSTSLRVGSHAVMSQDIRADDAYGQDPLPRNLAKATISFPVSERRGKTTIRTSRAGNNDAKVAHADSRLLDSSS